MRTLLRSVILVSVQIPLPITDTLLVGTDFIIFDVPPLTKEDKHTTKRYDELAAAFFVFLNSAADKPYKERKLIAASA